MTEQELLKKIRESAETVEIPERLSPEQIKNTLKLRAEWEQWEKNTVEEYTVQEGGKEGMEKKRKKEGSLWRSLYRNGRKYGAAAAVFFLLCGLSIFAAVGGWNGRDGGGEQVAEGSTEETGEIGTEGSFLPEHVPEVVPEPKKDAGELYVVASNYGEVYDAIKEVYYVVEESESNTLRDFIEDAVTSITGGIFNSGKDVAFNMTAEAPADMEAGTSAEPEVSESTGGSYSKTNLQTEGVDESDIIKTDGSYIYTVNGSSVYITDVRDREMKAAGEITIAMNSASDQVREMYVDGNLVNLIVSKQESGLKESTKKTTGQETVDVVYTTDVYYFDTDQVTELLTYDISDPGNPVLLGSVTQEGSYKTSRKIGDIVYLFTTECMTMPEGTRNAVIEDESVSGWIPTVDGEAITADCIYIPEQGTSGLVVSSVNVQNPDTIVDNMMILNNNVEIYVSTSAIYLYGRNYESSVVTEIAKFSMDQGVLNAVGAANVPGEVYDTFAVNEYQGRLRVLTTDWSNGDNENNLYLFDEELKLTGKLEGLAKGEQIYSARFFQNMAYFVTYRNIDPLFAVDLSDETNPKVLSELKITGFSEYLHFWGEDKLLGIGYETDPDTGRQEGLKLTMFDISNPADLKAAASCVLENVDYSPALYNYKTVLVDAGENLIGFAGVSYESKGDCNSYLLFSYEEGAFVGLMTETLAGDVYPETCRGLYIDDVFYLADPEGIISYDRADGYKMLQKFSL